MQEWQTNFVNIIHGKPQNFIHTPIPTRHTYSVTLTLPYLHAYTNIAIPSLCHIHRLTYLFKSSSTLWYLSNSWPSPSNVSDLSCNDFCVADSWPIVDLIDLLYSRTSEAGRVVHVLRNEASFWAVLCVWAHSFCKFYRIISENISVKDKNLYVNGYTIILIKYR